MNQPNGTPGDIAKCLSGEQHQILIVYERTTRWVDANDHGLSFWAVWGVPHRPSKPFVRDGYEWTRSMAASLSRSLRRLEARGLLERGNEISGDESKRTCNVKLTELGRAVARELMKGSPWLESPIEPVWLWRG